VSSKLAAFRLGIAPFAHAKPEQEAMYPRDFVTFGLGCALTLSIVVTASANTNVVIDRFTVTRNGQPFFEDRFTGTSSPPAAPANAFGQPMRYQVLGKIGQENLASGKLTLRSLDGVDNVAPSGETTRLNAARLLTDADPSKPRPGLKRDFTFSIAALFEFVMPGGMMVNSEGYGIRLANWRNNQASHVVNLILIRNNENKPVLRLWHGSFGEGQSSQHVITEQPIEVQPGQQILLTLSRTTLASSEITAQYQIFKGGAAVSPSTTLGTAPAIFDAASNWTRGEFFVFESMSLPASYGSKVSDSGWGAQPRNKPLLEQFRAECRSQLKDDPQNERSMEICINGKMWSLPPGDPPQDLELLEFAPWLVGNRGPSEAKGVILFLLSFNLDGSLDRYRLTPYFLKTLNEHGWDILEAKVPERFTGRSWGARLSEAEAPLVKGSVKALKDRGYRRVIAGGFGAGAWTAILAAQNGDLAADALLLDSPFGYGPSQWPDGVANPRFLRNLTELAPLVKNISLPTVFMKFAGDVWDYGQTPGELFKQSLGQRSTPNLVINHPPGFDGYFGAWMPIFDYAYGQCIEDFLERLASAPCALPPLSDRDFRSIVSLRQVADPQQNGATSVGRLLGKKFDVYPVDIAATHPYQDTENRRYEFVGPTQLLQTNHNNELRRSISFRDGLLCVGGSCHVLLDWSDGYLLEFEPETGNLLAWWIEDR
jgi:hypothetical protein